MNTTITISNELWKNLNKLRTEPGDTFDIIIKRLIKELKVIKDAK